MRCILWGQVVQFGIVISVIITLVWTFMPDGMLRKGALGLLYLAAAIIFIWWVISLFVNCHGTFYGTHYIKTAECPSWHEKTEHEHKRHSA